MPIPPSKLKRDKRQGAFQKASPPSSPEASGQPAEVSAPAKPIAILREREIPFEEERPPNFSPHFEVRVYRVRRGEKPQEAKR
jgi:hypothetical protein